VRRFPTRRAGEKSSASLSSAIFPPRAGSTPVKVERSVCVGDDTNAVRQNNEKPRYRYLCVGFISLGGLSRPPRWPALLLPLPLPPSLSLSLSLCLSVICTNVYLIMNVLRGEACHGKRDRVPSLRRNERISLSPPLAFFLIDPFFPSFFPSIFGIFENCRYF